MFGFIYKKKAKLRQALPLFTEKKLKLNKAIVSNYFNSHIAPLMSSLPPYCDCKASL